MCRRARRAARYELFLFVVFAGVAVAAAQCSECDTEFDTCIEAALDQGAVCACRSAYVMCRFENSCDEGAQDYVEECTANCTRPQQMSEYLFSCTGGIIAPFDGCDGTALDTCASELETCNAAAAGNATLGCRCYTDFSLCYRETGCAVGRGWATVLDTCLAVCIDDDDVIPCTGTVKNATACNIDDLGGCGLRFALCLGFADEDVEAQCECYREAIICGREAGCSSEDPEIQEIWDDAVLQCHETCPGGCRLALECDTNAQAQCTVDYTSCASGAGADDCTCSSGATECFIDSGCATEDMHEVFVEQCQDECPSSTCGQTIDGSSSLEVSVGVSVALLGAAVAALHAHA